MFNLGFGEMILLAAIALIVVGPKDLPKIAKVFGRTMNDVRNAIRDVTVTMTTPADEVKKHQPFETRDVQQLGANKNENSPAEKDSSPEATPGGDEKKPT